MGKRFDCVERIMGIYIKGMEMPTSCSVCPMLEVDRMDGLCHAASRWLDDDEFWTWYVYPDGDMDDSKPCNCPLVHVPPHGRLIDADALKAKQQEDADLFINAVSLAEKSRRDEALNAVANIVNAPTIIPGEE